MRCFRMLSRHRRAIACTVIAASVLGACARHVTARPTPAVINVWIRGVHVVDPSTGMVRRDRAIGIAQGVVAAVIASSAVPSDGSARVLDGSGTYAIPGLWDAHVHLLQADSAAAVQNAAVALSFGITHVRDMGSSMPARNAFLALLRTHSIPTTSMIGAGPTFWAFALPYGDKAQQVIITDTAATAAAVGRAAQAGVDFIKVYAGFDSIRLPPLMRAAAQYKLPVVGHAQPGMTLATQASMGMRTVEHLDFATLAECTSGASSYFDRVIAARFRNSGESIPVITSQFAEAVDTRDCRDRLRAAARSGLVLTPTLVVSYLSADDGQRLLSRLPARQREDCALYLRQFDGVGDAGRGTLPAAGRRLMHLVVDAGVPVLAGSDTPAFCARVGESLLLELQYLSDGGLSLLNVLRAATSLPARVFGARTFGSLAVGHAADLVLLRDNPLTSARAYEDPVGVYTQGRWYDHAAIASLRAQEQ